MTNTRVRSGGKRTAAAAVAHPRGPAAPTKATAPPKKGESSTGGQAPGSDGASRSRTGAGGGNAPRVSAPAPPNPPAQAAETEDESPGQEDQLDETIEAEHRVLENLPRAGTIVDVEVSRRAVQRLKPHIEPIKIVDTFQVSVNVAAPFDSKIDIFPNPRRPASSQSSMRLQ